MKASTKRLLEGFQQQVEGYEATADAASMDLRLDLADLILGALRTKGWSQKELARVCETSEPYISRVINLGANCSLDVVARILHALDIRPALVARGEGTVVELTPATATSSNGKADTIEASTAGEGRRPRRGRTRGDGCPAPDSDP